MADGTCSADGCGKPAHRMGLCNPHYRADLRKSAPPCSVQDCGKPAEKRGWCSMHYRRWFVHGDLQFSARGYAATLEAEAERRRKIGDAARGKKLGPRSAETRRKVSEALTGRPLTPAHRDAVVAGVRAARGKIAATVAAHREQQRAESGQELGYAGCHIRVRKARGRAVNHPCADCGKPAEHWAHTHDTDPTNPQNYRPLCRKCHFAYDDIAPRAVVTKGHERMSEAAKLAWETRRRHMKERVDDSPDPSLAGP